MSTPRTTRRSADLFERAQASIPGGASRSTVLIKPHPVYIAEAAGAWLTDVDGNRYLDVNNNWASIILGHADPDIERALAAQVGQGLAYSMAHTSEIVLAEMLANRVDSVDTIRFANSGTEAVMVAIKAARAFTDRPAIVKVEGSYHGTYDHAEASLDPDPNEWGDESSPTTIAYAHGTPGSLRDEVTIIPFNDAEAAAATIRRVGDQCAAVLIDPMPNRVGMPAIEPAFVDAVQSTAAEVGALVILDEVITFRLSPGGAQQRFDITPDLTTFGKIIGGGLPVGAVGGRADVMEVFAAGDAQRAALPSGGTFTANPMTMTAGLACLEQLDDAAYLRLDTIGDRTRDGLRRGFEQRGIAWQVTGAGSLFRIHPNQRSIRSFRDARHDSDEAAQMGSLQRELLDRQVYLSSYGMGCWNLATSDDDVDMFVEGVCEVAAGLAI